MYSIQDDISSKHENSLSTTPDSLNRSYVWILANIFHNYKGYAEFWSANFTMITAEQEQFSGLILRYESFTHFCSVKCIYHNSFICFSIKLFFIFSAMEWSTVFLFLVTIVKGTGKHFFLLNRQVTATDIWCKFKEEFFFHFTYVTTGFPINHIRCGWLFCSPCSSYATYNLRENPLLVNMYYQ